MEKKKNQTNLAQVVDVSFWILELKIMGHPHQVQQLPDAEEPVLGRVDGESDVLADDGGEGLPHELDTVVPITQPYGQLPLHVL